MRYIGKSKTGGSVFAVSKISDKERNQARKIQDRLLKLGAVKQFISNYGEHKPLFEGGPSASEIRSMVFPQWIYKFEEVLREWGGR